MQASVHRFDQATGEGSVLLDDGHELAFDVAVFEASGLRHLRTGQRLSVTVGDGRLTRLWIRGIGPGEQIR